MSAFEFEALDAGGRRRSGRIEAASREAALAEISALGLRALALVATSGELPFWKREIGGSGRASQRDVLAFMRDLSTLLGAGLTVDRALRLASKQAPKKLGGVVESMTQAVVAGRPLSDAMADHQMVFQPEVVEVTRAGEMTGALAKSLSDIADSIRRREEIRSAVISALIYPALLLVMAVAVTLLVAFSLVPSIAPLFDAPGAKAPAIVSVIEAVTAFVSAHPLELGAGALAAAAALAFGWRTPSVRAWRSRAAFRLPLLGPILVALESGRTCRVLGTLICAKVAILPAIAATERVPGSKLFRDALGHARRRVGEGARLGEALTPLHAAAPQMIRMIRTGEEVNRLGEMLLHAADLSDETAKIRIDRLFTLLTPAITAIFGLLIGGLILSIMSAVLSINDLAGAR